MRSCKLFWLLATDSFSTAKSRALTWAPGRRRQMQSRSSSKLSVSSSPSPVKRSFPNSMKCLSLMSRHSKASITSLEDCSCWNSAQLISPLPSESIFSKIWVIDSLTPSSMRRIFSDSAVLPTTSTRIPTSRFIMVKELSTTYTRNMASIQLFSVARIVSVQRVTSSRMVPMTMRLSMALPMEPKSSSIDPSSTSSSFRAP
mmetsp:Transcript_60210/g.158359  ORF Transcript_60210/g.158359 Transcript_60210/m.158359 type:complete len:201 (+) Transcript_60210:257-859(+)